MRRTDVPDKVRLDDTIPVIEIWGNLLVPLQGDISDRQMESMVDDVLRRIAKHGAEGLIIDASGVWLVDSHLCAGLGKLATAANIMGVPSVLCGLSSDVVMTLQTMGFEWDEIRTATTLERALEKLGLYVQKQPRSFERDDAREGERK